jgi:rhodanese-related sulfurtransferase
MILVLLSLPNTSDAFRDYTAIELKRLMDSGQPLVILNPLSEIEFNEGHIPGSVNIPAEEIRKTKRLPRNKRALIVTYCRGLKHAMYKQAADLVADRRYTNVATFKGGLPAWKKAGFAIDRGKALPKHKVPGIGSKKFKELVGTACIVDIRTPEFYGGSIDTRSRLGPKAKSLTLEYRKKYFLKIPLSKLAKQYRKIPNDRKIVLFDDSGKQCLVAARFLIEKGFKDVYMLKRGISAVPSETN